MRIHPAFQEKDFRNLIDMKAYVLLPIFNEEKTLHTQLERIRKTMEDRSLEYEILAYNDGSKDDSLKILHQSQKNLPLRVLGKEQNEGLGFAFRSLLEEVTALSANPDDIVVVQDSDNTHNPEHIYGMVNKIRDGFDVVIASRYRTDSRVVGVSPFRQFLSSVASWIMRILFPITGVRDYTCGYRAYSADTTKGFEKYGDRLIEENGFACVGRTPH